MLRRSSYASLALAIACVSCDDPGPRPVAIASIEVGVADTISLFDKTIVVGATLRDHTGKGHCR